MADTRAFNPEDVNCFHGYEGKRFIIEWKTDEDGHCLPEPLRYIKTEVSPMFNGGYRFVFQGSAKAGKSYLFPHEILDIRLVDSDDASRTPQPAAESFLDKYHRTYVRRELIGITSSERQMLADLSEALDDRTDLGDPDDRTFWKRASNVASRISSRPAVDRDD